MSTHKRTLKDRLALVNAGDTLTVEDNRGDTWTGKVRAGEETRALQYGTAKGSALRFAYTHNPGESVADIRDHVPAVIDTPEPELFGAVVRDAGGYVYSSLGWRHAARERFVPPNITGKRLSYADLEQPVTVLFEGLNA